MASLEQNIRSNIDVDYSPESGREYWRLYLNVCKISLKKYGFGILQLTSSVNHHQFLPSWRPYFQHPSRTNICRGSMVTQRTRIIWDGIVPESIELIPYSTSVIFRGIEVDRIQTIVNLNSAAIAKITTSYSLI
jgi:hypothetical protein